MERGRTYYCYYVLLLLFLLLPLYVGPVVGSTAKKLAFYSSSCWPLFMINVAETKKDFKSERNILYQGKFCRGFFAGKTLHAPPAANLH